jgi:type II secretory pathway pseudopilin PulG
LHLSLSPEIVGYEDLAIMKKSFKTMLGVTLLEIMLVLAIAAMVIVMSIRYYQSANASQQTNAASSLMTAIVAAADGLSQSGGTYSGNVSDATVQPLLPSKSLALPWGANATIGTVTASTIEVKFMSTPANVCPLLKAKFAGAGADSHFSSATSCGASGTTDLVIKYDNNPA